MYVDSYRHLIISVEKNETTSFDDEGGRIRKKLTFHSRDSFLWINWLLNRRFCSFLMYKMEYQISLSHNMTPKIVEIRPQNAYLILRTTTSEQIKKIFILDSCISHYNYIYIQLDLSLFHCQDRGGWLSYEM